MKRLVCLSTAFLLLALPSGALAMVGIEAAVGGWSQNPSGYVGYETRFSADRLDLEKDANYDRESRPMGRIKLDMPLVIPNIYLQATPMEFSGTGSRTENFQFGNVEFDATADFDSELQLDQYDVALYYGIPLTNLATLGMVNIDLGLNLRFIDLNAEVTGESASEGVVTRESRSATLAVPMLYAGVQISPVDRYSLDLEGRYITYSGNRYLDLVARLKAKIAGPVFAAGGWRYQDIKIDTRGIEGKLEVDGPFVETGFIF